jgi:hypothetical protein
MRVRQIATIGSALLSRPKRRRMRSREKREWRWQLMISLDRPALGTLQHDGVTRNTYETKEAAVAAASLYAARPRHPRDGASK